MPENGGYRSCEGDLRRGIFSSHGDFDNGDASNGQRFFDQELAGQAVAVK